MTHKPIMVYAAGKNPAARSHWYYNRTVELRFDQKAWIYYRVMPNGDLLPQDGVTKVCHIIDKSAPLMVWAVRKAMAKLKKIMMEREFCIVAGECATDFQPTLFEAILDGIIEEAKKADREELTAAGEVGHVAHKWIEDYITALIHDADDRRLELLAHLPTDERAANCCIAFGSWMAAHNVRWLATERKVYSLKHGVAGTMDGLARVDACTDSLCCPNPFKDRLSVIDHKTSNAIYLEYLLQTAEYQDAYEEETGEVIEDRWINRYGKEDAEFESWHAEGRVAFEEDLQGFLNALALVRSIRKIKGRIDGIKDVKKDYIRAQKMLAKEAELMVSCKGAKKYKGTRVPKCNGGHPCISCIAKYADTQRTNANNSKQIPESDSQSDETPTPSEA